MKKIITLLLVLILVGCGKQQTNKPNEVEEQNEDLYYYVEVNEYYELQREDIEDIYENYRPAKDYEYIAIDIYFENHTDVELSLYKDYIKVYVDDGFQSKESQYGKAMFVRLHHELNPMEYSVPIPAGKSYKGYVVIEAKKEWKKIEVIFDNGQNNRFEFASIER